MIRLLVALILFIGSSASAYFERVEVGGKALSMGKAFHAIADDPSAIYWNPAGLLSNTRSGLLLSHERPFGVEDLSGNFIGFAHHLSARTGVGIGWHHFGLSGVQSEDVFSVAVAREVDLLSWGEMGVGITGKLLRVAYEDFSSRDDVGAGNYGSQTELSLDLGVLYKATERVSVGATWRDLTEPTFDFVAGGGGTIIHREWEGGVAYAWTEQSTVTAALVQDHEGEHSLSLGSEISFFDVFLLRSGIFDSEFWGGFGLEDELWQLDTGFATHKALGVTWMASLTFPFGERRQ